MVKTCYFCRNRIKDNEDYCWVHNDKPRKIKKEQVKQEIKEMLLEQSEIHKTSYMSQLGKFRNNTSKSFEKEKRRFKKIESHHNQIMKIWEELYDEEYQVIPNKMKRFIQNSF